MSWGTDLWDQYDHLAFHTQKGIDFLEKYVHFIRDRCSIEVEYAGKLRRLVKSYQPKKKEDDEIYSTCKAFKMMMTEVNDMAGQHEVIAENLQTEVFKEVNALIKDFKDERKKLLNEGARLMTQLNNQHQLLDRSRKNYEKAYKEAERALDNYQKADADYNLSRAEVEKQKMNMTMKSQQCEDTKNEYANQLQRTNEQQRQHYQVLMPEVFRQLQDLDEKRIRNIRNYMIQSVQVERNVFPIINQCLDGIINGANQINEKEDTLQVIERYKSGFDPPVDIPFEDLSRIDGPGVHTPNSFHSTPPFNSEPKTVKGTLSFKAKKRVNIFTNIFSSNKEDYSDLPPNQRKKKLQSKLEELQAKIHQETAARDGLMKMKGVYEQNPNLGDPMSIEGQLHESGCKLDKLRQELNKFQAMLDDSNSNHNNHTNNSNHSNSNGNIQNHRNSGGSGEDHDHEIERDRSLSRSESDISVADNKNSAPGTPLPQHQGLSSVLRKTIKSKTGWKRKSRLSFVEVAENIDEASDVESTSGSVTGSGYEIPISNKSKLSSNNCDVPLNSAPVAPVNPEIAYYSKADEEISNLDRDKVCYAYSTIKSEEPNQYDKLNYSKTTITSSVLFNNPNYSSVDVKLPAPDVPKTLPTAPSLKLPPHKLPVENKPSFLIKKPPRADLHNYEEIKSVHRKRNSDSPESGIGASHSSLPESDEGPQHYYETELLPPLGTCKALYAFEATSEGSMDMIENEELLVIEADQGDGWTRVRRQLDSTEGFVPTSYIQLSLYNC